MITVGIVDRSEVFMLGLSGLLTRHGMRVVVTAQCPSRHLPGTVDVSVVEPEALDQDCAQEELGQLARTSRVLLMASRAGDPEIAGLLRYGAHGVALKWSEPHELVSAVETVAAGGIFPYAAAKMWAPSEQLPSESSSPILSDREKQVLSQLSAGLTHGQIARRLAISRHTVDTYVKRIRSKLGAGNKAELTRAAVSIGLCS